MLLPEICFASTGYVRNTVSHLCQTTAVCNGHRPMPRPNKTEHGSSVFHFTNSGVSRSQLPMAGFLFDWISAWRLPGRSLEIHSRIDSTFSRCLEALRWSQRGVLRNRIWTTHSCSFRVTVVFSRSIFWIRVWVSSFLKGHLRLIFTDPTNFRVLLSDCLLS